MDALLVKAVEFEERLYRELTQIEIGKLFCNELLKDVTRKMVLTPSVERVSLNHFETYTFGAQRRKWYAAEASIVFISNSNSNS